MWAGNLHNLVLDTRGRYLAIVGTDFNVDLWDLSAPNDGLAAIGSAWDARAGGRQAPARHQPGANPAHRAGHSARIQERAGVRPGNAGSLTRFSASCMHHACESSVQPELVRSISIPISLSRFLARARINSMGTCSEDTPSVPDDPIASECISTVLGSMSSPKSSPRPPPGRAAQRAAVRGPTSGDGRANP